MDDIQKNARKLRQEIRKKAKSLGISVSEYREQNGITKDTIRAKAANDMPQKQKKKQDKEPTDEWKVPFDGFSNKPKYPSLQFSKPFLRIVYNSLYNFDFLVYLAENGHYLTKKKIFREPSGEAHKL